MKKSIPAFILLIGFLACSTDSSERRGQLSIIPYPARIQEGEGHFELSAKTRIIINDNGEYANEVNELQTMLKKVLGQSLSQGKGKDIIEIKVSAKKLKPEAYELEITGKKITLLSSDPAGMFYAIQTLRQLLLTKIESGKTIRSVILPALSISDSPAFGWRGLNLDVSRHFFSVGYLKKCIDRLALYKFNRLHLHLTDDQGWRIVIKKYPLLTSTGAWRTFNRQDSLCMKRARENPDFNLDPQHIIIKDGKQLYGGSYTQDQIRDLVNYAHSKHVEIIPEIDMPGHMMAAIIAYPYLSCSGRAEKGDLFSSPLCAGKEEVYTFVEDVLTEILDLFPSRYIHIGADEVDKQFWTDSPVCKKFMKKEGIRDVDELQNYFVQRIQKFLAEKGRETIAWDEALTGGINPEVNIMYWRTWVASVPEKAVANGNKVINAQGDPLYFAGEGNSLYNIYHFNVIRNTIPADKAHLILGAHASIWTEFVPSEKIADSRMFPRMIALSEAVWSPDSIHDWDSFKYRLNHQLPQLTLMGINYKYNPSFALIPVTQVDTVEKRIGISFDSEKYHPDIFYTTDGTMPTTQSTPYKGTFYVTGSKVIRAAIFTDGKPQEPVLTLRADYHKAIGKKVIYHKLWNLSYPAGDAGALTDGYRGGSSYNDGHWQGFTTDLDVTVDMGKPSELNRFSATFMQITGPGVFMPDGVEVSLSNDGAHFEKILTVDNDIPRNDPRLLFKDFSGSLGGKTARYIRVVAHNNSRDFIFTDEIVIN
jgi:hexosaminidase